MNNEETIIAQPKSNEQSAPVQEKKNKKGSHVAATAAAAAVGGVVGGVGTAAAMSFGSNTEENEPQKQEQEAKIEGQNAQAENSNSEDVPVVTAQVADDESTNTNNGSTEPDYTYHDNADPVISTDEQGQAIAAIAVEDYQPEVRVLGTYENVTDDGIHQTAAILTNGTEVAAVVDIDGDGIADVLAVDNNHNNQIDEGEVVDFSDQNVHMNEYDQMYLAQQQAESQMDDMAQNAANDNLPDYDNNGIYDA